jgi:hypothetical protein
MEPIDFDAAVPAISADGLVVVALIKNDRCVAVLRCSPGTITRLFREISVLPDEDRD